MIIIFEILLILYCLIMILMFLTLLSIPKTQNLKFKEKSISILVPFKNEALNLEILLESILELSYSNFEVILINDHSSDNGALIINTFIKRHSATNIQVINQDISISGKKNAIIKAVSVSKYEFCVQTDADCKLPKDWLSNFNQEFETTDLVLGNVLGSTTENTFISAYQEIEFYMLEGIKIASTFYGHPLLASGASLGYKKDLFISSKPFEENKHIASGDDMFILQKFKESKFRIKTLNFQSQVHTRLLNSWKDIIAQRTRWAAKTPKLNSLPLNLFGGITVLMNIISLISLILFFIYGLNIFLLIVLSKFFVEFLVLFLLVFRQNRLKLLIYTPIMIIAYPIVLITIIGNGIFYKNSW